MLLLIIINLRKKIGTLSFGPQTKKILFRKEKVSNIQSVLAFLFYKDFEKKSKRKSGKTDCFYWKPKPHILSPYFYVWCSKRKERKKERKKRNEKISVQYWNQKKATDCRLAALNISWHKFIWNCRTVIFTKKKKREHISCEQIKWMISKEKEKKVSLIFIWWSNKKFFCRRN